MMQTIDRTRYNLGGAGQGSGKNAGNPQLNSVLAAVADDLLGQRNVAIASANATDLATAITLVNEIKAALNRTSATQSAPVLNAGANEPYDIDTAGYNLTVEIDGVNRVFSFVASDFVDPTAATAAEIVGALNSRGYLAFGASASVTAGPKVTLTGQVGGTHTLNGVAGGAQTALTFPTTAVRGTGFVPNLAVVG
jgi:hypothetical protein